MLVRRLLMAVVFPTVLFLALPQSLVRAQEPETSQPSTSPLATDLPDSSETEVFVLGSIHLSNVADQFEPSMIDSLMTALVHRGGTNWADRGQKLVILSLP